MRSEKSGAPSAARTASLIMRAPPQFVKRQCRVDPARAVEVAVGQAIEDMADVDPALPAGGVRVTHDVDRAAVGQQVIELRPIGEFVDPLQVDQEQPARIVGRGVEAIEVDRLLPVVGAHAHEVVLVAHHVDQLELLEHRGDRRKALADLRPRLDRDAQRRRVVEDETDERVSDRPLHEVGHVEIESDQVRQQHLALLIAHREIIPAAVVEIAHAGDAHAVAVDDGPRHRPQPPGDQLRSCEGLIDIHHATTPR